MQQSRRELLDEFLRFLDEYNDREARNLAELLLNRAYRDVWMAHPFNDHRLPNPIQITTVSGTRSYALPPYFGRIPPRVDSLQNVTTRRTLALRSQDFLEKEYPDAGTTIEASGDPFIATLSGSVGVSVQPSSGGQALEVVSSHASDTDIKVVLEGLDSDGNYTATQIALNGTSAVAAGTWKPPLINFSKSYAEGDDPATELTSSRGTITLRVAGAGATLQTLLPAESAVEFPSLTLYNKPSTSGQVIAVPCIRAPRRLLYDADEIPRFWGSALLERMHAYWKSNTGHVLQAGQLASPDVIALIRHDNSNQERIRTTPFGGR